MKQTRGITLVALVVTIVVLLILAGISIQALTNQGLFGKAQEAKQRAENAQKEEDEILKNYLAQMNEVTGNNDKPATNISEAQLDDMLTKRVNSSIVDAYGNKITIPAGFKIKADSSTNNATTVNAGIVILDSNGNEFVWIPVGKIYTDVERTDANAETIELGRYDFDSTTGEKSAYSGSDVEEDSTDTANLKNYGNKIAKNINDFKTKGSITRSGGFYIGRYEAGVTGYDANAITTSNSNSETNWTGYTNAEGEELKLVCKAGQQVWNYVTQNKAADLARNMYENDKPFTSDLMNSYAWDTAIVFEQTFDDRTEEDKTTPYSIQNSLNQGSSPATTGTTDKICNIYDMASNVREWTTETSNSSNYPCVDRGGSYYDSSIYTSTRSNPSTSVISKLVGFRPLLYV